MRKLLVKLCLIFTCLQCHQAQDIDLILPYYAGKLMVECYLEPGKGYRMLLTESVSYLEPSVARPVINALVTIKYKNRIDTLFYKSQFIDVKDSIKYYNYVNSRFIIPRDYVGEFELNIRDRKGRVATAKTTIAMQSKIDSAKVVTENGARSALVYINDDQTITKYYRFLVFRGNNQGIETQSTINDNQLLKLNRFVLNNDKQIIFQSKNDFFIDEKGKLIDSVGIRNIQINKDYYDFITSVRNAQSANGNPFAQPASIRSNITGGVGIFTGFDPAFVLLKVD